MKKIQMIWMAVALLLSAQAAMSYGTSYVSRTGTDSASCGISFAPCYSLAAALANTDNGGTVKILDANAIAPSGIVITRPVTIDGSGLGVVENIFASSVPAIQAMADCTIRNLIVQVTANDGIEIGAANVQVHLENVQIEGASGAYGAGVHVAASGVNLTVDRTTITGAATGINLASGTTFSGNGVRILSSTVTAIAMAGGSGTLRDSVLHGMGAVGLQLTSGAVMMADRCEFSGNATGAMVDGSSGVSILRLSNSVVASNGTGLATAGAGQIVSFRTNMIGGNGADGVPPLASSLK